MAVLEEHLRLQAASSVVLRRIEVEARRQASLAFSAVQTRFTAALVSVVRNNPGKSASDVLSREDVVATLSEVLEAAMVQARAAVQSAHVSAASLGALTGQADLRRLGIESGEFESPPTSYLDQVLADLDTNVARAAQLVVSAVVGAWDQPLPESYHQVRGGSKNPVRDQARARAAAISEAMARVRRELSLRTELSVSAAANRAYTDAQLLVYESAREQNPGLSLRKVWVAHFTDNNPCPTCTALHGTVVGIEEEFSYGSSSSPRVYRDLLGPPRHPNCRCRVVPYIEELDSGALTPKSMRAIAARVARPVRSMSAASVRAMPARRFQAVLAALQAVLSAVRRLR